MPHTTPLNAPAPVVTPLPSTVLAIEDRPTDARWIDECLKAVPESGFRVLHAATLRQGLDTLAQHDVGVVLLDLNLPDSTGLDTARAVLGAANRPAVIVTTSTGQDAIALEAVRLGAQDYLTKGEFDGRSLVRALQYAKARQELSSIAVARSQEAEHELSMLRQSVVEAGAQAQARPEEALQKSSPAFFATALQDLSNIILESVEARDFAVQRNVTGHARALAKRLHAHGAGARDVIDLYSAALTAAGETGIGETRMATLASEARVRIVELMGHLVEAYRQPTTAPRSGR